jgi:hypothetical protein
MTYQLHLKHIITKILIIAKADMAHFVQLLSLQWGDRKIGVRFQRRQRFLSLPHVHIGSGAHPILHPMGTGRYRGFICPEGYEAFRRAYSLFSVSLKMLILWPPLLFRYIAMKHSKLAVGFEVVTAVVTKSSIFCDITPYN